MSTSKLMGKPYTINEAVTHAATEKSLHKVKTTKHNHMNRETYTYFKDTLLIPYVIKIIAETIILLERHVSKS